MVVCGPGAGGPVHSARDQRTGAALRLRGPRPRQTRRQQVQQLLRDGRRPQLRPESVNRCFLGPDLLNILRFVVRLS